MQPEEPLRLLLVEDEPTQRLLLHRLLTRSGYRVETARNGEEALACLLQGQVQILITDWEMPEMDGVTLCRRARQASLAGYLYILLLTSHGSSADIVAGLDAGADDFLKKPADEGELLARLKAGRRIINLERSLREAHTQLALLASTDPLLQTYNRRHLMTELPREVERALRYHRPLSVIMADLDHFKRVNDVYGHHAGDAALLEFSRVARSSIRRSDWVARSGGEEFIIVLPETPLENALLTAEKIRVACEATPIQAGPAAIRLTASFGVAAMNPAADPARAVAELLRQADTALYRSKHAGRNRVSAAERSPVAV